MRKHLELLQKIADSYYEDISKAHPTPGGIINEHVRTYCQTLCTIIKIKEELASQPVLSE